MISATEFIWAYGELFKFIDRRHGKQSVVRLWEALSDEFLGNLDRLVAEKGIEGMAEYWTHTLSEEGGRCVLTVRDDEFIIDMHACPSAALVKSGPARPYRDYCGHCGVLYKRVIEKHGYKVYTDIIDCDRGACRFHVVKATKTDCVSRSR